MRRSSERLRELIDWNQPKLSIREQCELLQLNRSTLYYEPLPESVENLEIMRRIDEQYLKRPHFGSRLMTVALRRQGYRVNRKRVRRLMAKMGLVALYAKPRTTIPATAHRVYAYLLRGVQVERPNQVWGADITYVPLRSGYLYLVAILDWFSRHVLSWGLSNSLDSEFCVAALEQALDRGRPEIFNTDQGCQFTSRDFTSRLESARVTISMNGRGRALDNVFVERLWRTVKYEEIYLKDYETGAECREGLRHYFRFYNHERPHQSLGYRTPWETYTTRRYLKTTP